MLILPVFGNISRKSFPFATMLLIGLCTLVFFIFQSDDGKKAMQAHEFYLSSGLFELEMDLYLTELHEKGELEQPLSLEEMQEDEVSSYFEAMHQDRDFQKRIDDHILFSPEDPRHEQWVSLRRELEGKLNELTSMQWGFKPSDANPLTFVTHMFLHGGFGHLLGNMIFLWMVGALLEMGWGRRSLLEIYFLGGLAAVLLYWSMYSENTVPLVGASGAISGLMGATTVLFGMQRIRIFYSLGFYFNYTSIPALILLPLWVGNEFFQLTFGEASNVAYMAHIGGLIGGAGLGYIIKRSGRTMKTEAVQDTEHDPTGPLLERAMERMANLDLPGASADLESVLAIQPENLDALRHLYTLDMQLSNDDRVHKSAEQYIQALLQQNMDRPACEAFTDYSRKFKGKSGKMRPRVLVTLAGAFARSGHLKSAESLLAHAVRSAPRTAGIPGALLSLGQGYMSANLEKRSSRCLQFLAKKFPGTPEAETANRLLSSMAGNLGGRS